MIEDPTEGNGQLNLPFSGTVKKTEEILNTDNTTVLTLSLSGNPWSDAGIISLCHELERISPSFLAKPITWTEFHVVLCFYNDPASIKEMKVWFYDRLRNLWNEIFWLSRPAKVLNQSFVKKDGFIDDSAQFPIAPAQKEILKNELNGTFKDSSPISQVRLNYIGTRSDRNKIRDQIVDNVNKFIHEIVDQKGDKYCDLCGRNSYELVNATQGINPLLNKHHNSKLRGFANQNDYYEECPICYLTNLYTALNAKIPFVYDTPNKQTSLILPDISSLELLRKVMDRLEKNLRDLGSGKEIHTSTNLRGYFSHDPYSLALALFHNIFYEFSILDEDQEEWSWNPVVEKRQLNRWVIIPFVKPQNVRFGNIHIVDVDNRIYDFIKPIPFDDDIVKLVPDILSRMSPKSRRPDGIMIIRHLCQAIATSDVSFLNTALFELYKHGDGIIFRPQRGRPHPKLMLPQFIEFFLEVNAVLDKELRDDLRALGTSIGMTFSHDVTLISKIYNISNESAFRSVLNQVMFRLYKLSTSGKSAQGGKIKVTTQGESKDITRVSQERVTNILERLSEDNWKEMAETLSTFACLSAFNSNF